MTKQVREVLEQERADAVAAREHDRAAVADLQKILGQLLCGAGNDVLGVVQMFLCLFSHINKVSPCAPERFAVSRYCLSNIVTTSV